MVLTVEPAPTLPALHTLQRSLESLDGRNSARIEPSSWRRERRIWLGQSEQIFALEENGWRPVTAAAVVLRKTVCVDDGVLLS